jgi:hypothetical protein
MPSRPHRRYPSTRRHKPYYDRASLDGHEKHVVIDLAHQMSRSSAYFRRQCGIVGVCRHPLPACDGKFHVAPVIDHAEGPIDLGDVVERCLVSPPRFVARRLSGGEQNREQRLLLLGG